MEVILLERVAKLGQMGDTVRVKDGFARNFLLPRGKALRATKDNKERFETERAQLEARNLERRTEAKAVADKLDGQSFVVIRQAGETGVLYGSVSTRDLAETMTAGGFTVDREQVALNAPIKTLGLHTVPVEPPPRGRGEGDDQRRPQPRGGRAPGARRDRHDPRGDEPRRARPRGRRGAGRSWPRRRGLSSFLFCSSERLPSRDSAAALFSGRAAAIDVKRDVEGGRTKCGNRGIQGMRHPPPV